MENQMNEQFGKLQHDLTLLPSSNGKKIRVTDTSRSRKGTSIIKDESEISQKI